jgi:WD40 repeat protein
MSRLLERGRALLRDRLARRGIGLSAALLAVVLAENARAVTPALAAGTLRAAAAGPISSSVLTLVEGVIRQMFLTRIKVAAALLLTLGLLGAGAGLLTARGTPQPGQPAPRSGDSPRGGEKADDEARFESPLPAGALARLGTSRFQHATDIRGLAFSPDGKVIASGSGRGTIRLWDAETGRELKVLPAHGSGIAGLAFSPDGKTLASASYDRTARLWDVAGGQAIRTFNGHAGIVVSVAFSPDGKRLLTTSADQTARVWEVATGTELLQLQGHEKTVEAGAFSHDGKLIATGSQDKMVSLWDAAGGKELKKLEGHTSEVHGVAFSPDDKRLISGGYDIRGRLWDVTTGKPLGELVQVSGIGAVVFSPDGKRAAMTSGWENVVAMWDVAGDAPKRLWMGKVNHPHAVAFSPDGKKVTAAGWDSRVRVWDAATGQESPATQATGHAGWVNGVGYLAGRTTLVSASNEGRVIVWDTTGARGPRVLQAPTPRSWCLAVAPDGKTFATGGNNQAVSVWDAAAGKVTATLKFEGPIKGIAFSPDGKRLAAVSDDSPEGSAQAVAGHGAAIFDLATGKILFRLEGHESGVRAVAWSADGKLLITGGSDRTGRLWDAANGKELRKFEGHAGTVEAVAFSPDGQLAATGGFGGTVLLWRLGTDDPARPINTKNNGLSAVVFSPDSRLVAIATRQDNQVKFPVTVWDVMTAKERAQFVGHQETASSLAFSADGRVLVSGGGDGTVLLWDLTGRVENGKFATAELPGPSLEGVWTDLGGDDGFKVHKAVWSLAAAPKQALPLLRGALKPVAEGDEKRIAQLVKDLDSDDFDVREKASAELARIGDPAAPALRKAMDGVPSAEMRARITQLLDKFGGKVASADLMRRERAMEVLEHIGGAEARALLEELAKGAPEAALTQEAKAALKRLGK